MAIGTVFASFIGPTLILIYPFIALFMQLCGAREPKLDPPHNRNAMTAIGKVYTRFLYLIGVFLSSLYAPFILTSLETKLIWSFPVSLSGARIWDKMSFNFCLKYQFW